MGTLNAKVWGLIPHGDLFGTWVFGKKTSFAVLIKLLLNFQVGVRWYMFFLLGKKLFRVNFVKKSEHYEVELELNGRGISEFRKIP